MATDPVANVRAFMKLTQAVKLEADYGAAVAKKSLDIAKDQAAQLIKLIANTGQNVDLKG